MPARFIVKADTHVLMYLNRRKTALQNIFQDLSTARHQHRGKREESLRVVDLIAANWPENVSA
jgi:hypothetical protein